MKMVFRIRIIRGLKLVKETGVPRENHQPAAS